MNIKIENMIDLRLRCVELALEFYKDNKSCDTGNIKHCAKFFESYILCDSELPKSPMSMDRVIYETMLKMINDNKETNDAIEKIKETLANNKNE